ncbi:hypothetical protein U1Q18_034639 [Sarracenia purpurea var. burkii]
MSPAISVQRARKIEVQLRRPSEFEVVGGKEGGTGCLSGEACSRQRRDPVTKEAALSSLEGLANIGGEAAGVVDAGAKKEGETDWRQSGALRLQREEDGNIEVQGAWNL